jgi:hypothetical protein
MIRCLGSTQETAPEITQREAPKKRKPAIMSIAPDEKEWFAQELGQFVPPDILDFALRTAPAPPELAADGLATDLSDALFDRPLRVHFAAAKHGSETNEYVEKAAERQGLPPLMGFSSETSSPETLKASLAEKPFAGIVVPDAGDLSKALPEWAADITNDLGRIVLLDGLRLETEKRAQEVIELCGRYGHAKFIVEGAGSFQTLTDAAVGLLAFRDVLNLFFSVAGVTHWQIIESLFAAIDGYRILYATGGRQALERGKSVVINDYIVETAPQFTRDADGDAPPFTFRLYEQLWAIRTAAQRLGSPRDYILDLFCDNAERLLKVAVRKS